MQLLNVGIHDVVFYLVLPDRSRLVYFLVERRRICKTMMNRLSNELEQRVVTSSKNKQDAAFFSDRLVWFVFATRPYAVRHCL